MRTGRWLPVLGHSFLSAVSQFRHTCFPAFHARGSTLLLVGIEHSCVPISDLGIAPGGSVALCKLALECVLPCALHSRKSSIRLVGEGATGAAMVYWHHPRTVRPRASLGGASTPLPAPGPVLPQRPLPVQLPGQWAVSSALRKPTHLLPQAPLHPSLGSPPHLLSSSLSTHCLPLPPEEPSPCSCAWAVTLAASFLAPESLMQALEDLDYLAALDNDGNLSEFGIIMSEFPLDPQLSRSILASCEFDCVDEMLTIAAMVTGAP